MRIATIFTFDAGHKTTNEKNKFYWRLYGCKRSSNFGRYVYEEKGILSDLIYLKPSESVIIVSNKNAELLREFFKGEKVRFSEHKIILTEKESRNLF